MYVIFSDPIKYPVHRIEQEFPNTQFFYPITEDQLPPTAAIVYEVTPPQVTFTQQATLDPLPKLIDGRYYTSYTVRELTGAELASAKRAKELEYDAHLQHHFDQVAQSRGYTNWMTCSLRAGKPGPYEAEGTAFFNWMESCNQQAFQLLNEVLSGAKPLPTPQEFIASLPRIQWP